MTFLNRFEMCLFLCVILGVTPFAQRSSAFAEIVAYEVKQTNQPPKIDGRLDDACWKDACTVNSFSIIGRPGEKTSAGVSTAAFVAFDTHNLYIGFDCEEPLIDKLVTDTHEHDGPTWKDDGVEIFLNPSGDRTRYVQLAINAAGVVMDAYISQPRGRLDLKYETRAQVKTAQGQKRYTLECKIPFRGLPLASPNSEWTFHLARNRRAAGQLITSLQSPVTGYHEISRFDPMKGIRHGEYPISIESIDFGDGFQGTNLLKAKLKNWSEKKADLTMTLTVGSKGPLKKPFSLAAHAQELLTIPFEVSEKESGQGLKFSVHRDGKLLQQRTSGIAGVPPIIGGLHMRACYQAPDDFVRLAIPIQIAEGSRGDSRLYWDALNSSGEEVGSGFTSVAGKHAVLRLFWLKWRPGRYGLKLRLVQGDTEKASREEELRFLPSPWGGK